MRFATTVNRYPIACDQQEDGIAETSRNGEAPRSLARFRRRCRARSATMAAARGCPKGGDPIMTTESLDDASAEWQPIDTAPQDGTAVLGFFPDRGGNTTRRDVRWSTGHGRWISELYGSASCSADGQFF